MKLMYQNEMVLKFIQSYLNAKDELMRRISLHGCISIIHIGYGTLHCRRYCRFVFYMFRPKTKMKRLVLSVRLARFGRLGLIRDLHIKIPRYFLTLRKLMLVKDEALFALKG